MIGTLYLPTKRSDIFFQKKCIFFVFAMFLRKKSPREALFSFFEGKNALKAILLKMNYKLNNGFVALRGLRKRYVVVKVLFVIKADVGIHLLSHA